MSAAVRLIQNASMNSRPLDVNNHCSDVTSVNLAADFGAELQMHVVDMIACCHTHTPLPSECFINGTGDFHAGSVPLHGQIALPD